ncbi:hypothetical protein F4604DRAFT_1926127 [Suillus subluteus]|nr:hypothetical protein F4604DRAFT_1926127 [Suillus subluteus]
MFPRFSSSSLYALLALTAFVATSCASVMNYGDATPAAANPREPAVMTIQYKYPQARDETATFKAIVTSKPAV